MSPRTFVARSAAILSLAALGLAACETKTVVQPPVQSLNIVVSPASVTLKAAGQKAQFVAVVTGGTTDQVKTYSWSSSNTAVATVDGSGVVTAVANGVATITATATADANVKSAGLVTVDIPVVVPPVVVPPTISIQSVTNNLGQNVPLNNVSGQINVNLNVDPGQNNVISKIEVLVDGTTACSQTFTQGSQAQVGVEATNAPVVISCSILTTALKADGTPVYPNGNHTITARLVGPTGNILANPVTETFTFNNTSSLGVAVASVKTASDAIGLVWNGGNLTVTVTPTIFGSTTLQSVTITVSGDDPSVPASYNVTKTVTTTGVGAVSATFRGDSAASAGTGIKGIEDSTTVVTVSAVTSAGQPFQGGVSGTQQTFTNQVRYDALAPRIGTQPTFLINTVGGTSWLSKANKFSQTCSSTATVGVFNCSLSSVVTDLGVDVVKAAFQTDLASASPKTWPNTITSFADLSEKPAGTQVARLFFCDNLTNCTASAVSIAFGIDLTPPVSLAVTDVPNASVQTAPLALSASAIDSLSGFDLTNGYVQVQITKDSAKSDGSDVKTCVSAATGATTALPSSGTCAFVTVPGPVPPAGSSFTIPVGTNGYFTVVIKATDIAGNESATTSRFFLMDAVAPTISGVSVSYTTGTFTAGVGGTIQDNVDLKEYTAYETFAAAIAGVTAIPFAAPTTVKPFGIPVNGKVTATANTPVIIGVALGFGVAGTGSTGFGFGGLDQAGNFALGTVGLVPGTPAAVSGTDISSNVSGATQAGVCNGALADCDGTHQAASTQDSVLIVMANTTTANPIVTMYFYRVVTYGATSVARFVSAMATPNPGIPASGPYQNLRVFTYKSAAIAAGDMATGDNSLFAIGVDKNGNGVLFGPVTVNVQTP